MDTAAEILVIIVSAVLSVLLILLIIASVYGIRLMHNIKRVIDKAEKVVDSAEVVGEVFKNVSGPLAFAKLMKNIIHIVQRKSGKSKPGK